MGSAQKVMMEQIQDTRIVKRMVKKKAGGLDDEWTCDCPPWLVGLDLLAAACLSCSRAQTSQTNASRPFESSLESQTMPSPNDTFLDPDIVSLFKLSCYNIYCTVLTSVQFSCSLFCVRASHDAWS
jgi:hypothetical protein